MKQNTIEACDQFLSKYSSSEYSPAIQTLRKEILKKVFCKNFKILKVEYTNDKQTFLNSLDVLSGKVDTTSSGLIEGYVFMIVVFTINDFKNGPSADEFNSITIKSMDIMVTNESGEPAPMDCIIAPFVTKDRKGNDVWFYHNPTIQFYYSPGN